MERYSKADAWNIIEEGFDPQKNKIAESLFSIGNGRMGQRANFEETYSGETLQGSYVAGIFYPDKTRVGWWKNGYPETFDKVINSINWIGLEIEIDGEVLDLHQCEVLNFNRTLNMQDGYLSRSFEAKLTSGKIVKVNSIRFCSIDQDEIAGLRYQIEAVNFSGKVKIISYLDGDVRNEDSNYETKFWDFVRDHDDQDTIFLQTRTLKTQFDLAIQASNKLFSNNTQLEVAGEVVRKEKFIAKHYELSIKQGEQISLEKIAAVVSSLNYNQEDLYAKSAQILTAATALGFEKLKQNQAEAWTHKWAEGDLIIEGDLLAQQGIRFSIFQLYQTYTGKDARLNIGPKGFTGEKYAGATYWDTEAYCLPFYLATSPVEVSRNLLVYRHNHLQKAIENAQTLGFTNGAALFPMVTMDGTESHNEWEITFEEIHRNGAIAFAIYNYVRYTGDEKYLTEFGLDVLLAIARFWKQRVNWSKDKNKFVMLGVTGPNEYENNVNNNWYTNRIALWCLDYTKKLLESLKVADLSSYEIICSKNSFEETELSDWQNIIDNLYFPEDKSLGIFLQQDGYLDKEDLTVSDLQKSERPINQNWSWDRILRSPFIKQADVLQGLYFFEEDYDQETLQRNYDYYEPKTVHESSLSPCIHSILAAKLKREDKAYEFYLRTARLDLDNYNNDTEDGLHITSMAGSWMSIIEGFAGMRVKNGKLNFTPFLPESWNAFSFKITFRESLLEVRISKNTFRIQNNSAHPLSVVINNHQQIVNGESEINYPLKEMLIKS
ncbi:family 65 glycosyl hydrolase domain-containing protein [Sphingobacterium hungaricum]|uniref:Family 65 glycosyl hydrolase n=1 Tax=Sphingobacterium hungaricum TaxID=2082723 RepID=A0A928UYV3_9SPHI|nr:family 65 glycosyl hydrolase domain-containing protein [Sphingobacterium hungaricum]MBE8713327.1 family 65 glycosyl hydrolase [Sphingobacterium hungaricum]